MPAALSTTETPCAVITVPATTSMVSPTSGSVSLLSTLPLSTSPSLTSKASFTASGATLSGASVIFMVSPSHSRTDKPNVMNSKAGPRSKGALLGSEL